MKLNVELPDLKSGYGVTPEDGVFTDKMYQVLTLLEIYGWKKGLPFTETDTCKIMPEVFINIFMLFYLIYLLFM